MILKEIEMDLPYVREPSSEDDTISDYESNWKANRRQFQLATRCMTSMIERTIHRITTKDCWKLLIECVKQPTTNKIINSLGVYRVQVPFDIDLFWAMSSLEKKVCIIGKIREALIMIAQNGCFDIRAIVDACDEVVNHDYVNEWYWKKTLKSKSLSVQVKILHEVEGVHLYWVFRDSLKNVQKEKLIISDIPDERVYDKYFGKLEWISDRTARLTAKTGEHYIAAYD